MTAAHAETSGARPVALVTGAGGGMGAGICAALAEKGFDLILNDREEGEALTRLADAVGSFGGDADILVQDISRAEELAAFVSRAYALHGRLDCLVNNAGVSVLSRGDILDVAPESFDRCIAVNLRGQFFLTQEVARRMVAEKRPEDEAGQRRSIITITSVAVDNVIGKVIAEYSIAKAALSHMVKHFAARLATEGVDCFEVRPGMTATNMTQSSREKYDALIEAGFVPAGRWGTVSDVGHVVANLADGALRYAVGQTIHVDGGMALKVF